jgi:hypothetical protein
MNIFLEIYIVSGALVGLIEGLLLERSAKKLLVHRKMKSIDDAVHSVMFGTILIAITPVLNTLHLFVKTLNLFVKSK